MKEIEDGFAKIGVQGLRFPPEILALSDTGAVLGTSRSAGMERRRCRPRRLLRRLSRSDELSFPAFSWQTGLPFRNELWKDAWGQALFHVAKETGPLSLIGRFTTGNR